MRKLAFTLALCLLLSVLPAWAEPVPAEVDWDLATLDIDEAYHILYAMYDAYIGQTVRVRGPFTYFQLDADSREHFYVGVGETTSCCGETLDFTWAGEHSYPDDYPEQEALITVTGVLSTYEEYEVTWLELLDAEVVWDEGTGE